MALNVSREVATMERMTVRELREKYAEVFGEAARSGNKQWLVKRIAWRLQANAEGDLSERARQRALELSNDADLRVTAPKAPAPTPGAAERTARKRVSTNGDHRLPMPGTLLTREYKGESVQVMVLADGFEYAGEVFKSLSAVTRAITGTHRNGYHFFGLKKNGRAK